MKLKNIMLLTSILASAGQANAASITLTGTLETKKPIPSVHIETKGDLVAFVKKFKATVSDAADGCRLFTTQAAAVQNTIAGERSCLIEWDTISGVAKAGMRFEGYSQETGNVVQNYTVSYFSGLNQEKVIVNQGSISHNILVPVAPTLEDAVINVQGESLVGFTNVIYKKEAGFSDLVLKFEPRNYDLHLDFDLGSGGTFNCTIPEGDTDCRLTGAVVRVGQTSGELQGAEVYNIQYNSKNNYFNAATHNVNYEFLWDYRPPYAESIFLNASFDESDKIEIVNDVPYTLAHGEGIIVVGSPHGATLPSKDWWKPTKALISFSPDDTKNELEVYKVVDGNTLFRGRDLSWGDNYDVSTIGEYSLAGNDLVYKFKLDNVPDGGYQLTTNMTDLNGNTGVDELGLNSIFRDKPEIKVFNNYSVMNDESPMYFMEHMIVAGYNNFAQGVTIDSVKLNGIEVEMISGKDHSVKYLSSKNLVHTLTPDTLYEIEVNATDMAGGHIVHKQNLAFAPVNYELLGVGDNQYFDVTEFKVYLNSTKGKKCSQASDEAIANGFGSRGSFSCTVDWSSYPDGLNVDSDSLNHQLHGVIKKDSAVKNIEYTVNYYDGEGNVLVVAQDTVNFNLKEPTDPEVNLLPYDVIDESTVAVSILGGDFSYSSVLGVPAAMELTADDELDNKDEDYYFWKARPNRRDPNALQKGSAKLFLDKGDLWDKRTVKLDVNYKLAPDYKVTETIGVVYVPPKRTYAYSWLSDDFGLTTQQLKVGARVGEFLRREAKYNYTNNVHGEWNLTLERQISRHEYEDVSDAIVYDGSSDEVYFNVDGSNWLGTNKLCVRADVMSPVAGYSRSIRSSCVRLAVFKGEGIDGTLVSRRMVGRIPFKMAATYQYAEKADRDSSENVVWEISEDEGATWSVYTPERKYKSSVRFVFENTGKWLVRGVVKNKFTGLITNSNEIEVVAYDVPEVKIEGPSSVYIGEFAELKLVDEVTASDAFGEIEWSTDNGVNWIPGDNTLILDTSEVKLYKILSRMRYDDIDANIERSWNEDLHYLKVSAPAKPPISIKGTNEIEAGESIRLTASTRTNDRVVHFEWTLPDGSVVMNNILDFVMNDNAVGKNIEYRELKVSAWLDGFKQETLTSRVHKIRVWQYTQPDAELRVQTSVKYDPAYVRVTIKQDRMYAPDVEYFYELDINPSEVEIVNQTDNKFDLKIYGVKTHQIKGVVTDNRGNTTEAINFIEVLQPDPLKVGIKVRALSNKVNREPLTTYLQATRILPHKKDSIKFYEWKLNGVLLNTDDVAPNYWTIEDLPEGSHVITLKATTEFGQVAEETMTIEVIDNIKPTCEIEFKQNTSSLDFDASCLDSDGTIIRYEWLINDNVVSINERVNYFKYPHLKDVNSVVVKLKVYDDSYEFVEYIDTYPVTH